MTPASMRASTHTHNPVLALTCDPPPPHPKIISLQEPLDASAVGYQAPLPESERKPVAEEDLLVEGEGGDRDGGDRRRRARGRG
jgi:hypothetical protein